MNRPKEAVTPVGMELLMFYPCPHCGHKVPVLAPLQPATVRCDLCGGQFSVVPVDAKSVRFFKAMMAGGPGGIDGDYIG
ncbi:MAG: hypothetical protein WCR47_02800 [Desulfoplanes sp.]|jgi:transcription elongation factor Elf1|nr:hypothetical protein [Desulfoplanes sp.]